MKNAKTEARPNNWAESLNFLEKETRNITEINGLSKFDFITAKCELCLKEQLVQLSVEIEELKTDILSSCYTSREKSNQAITENNWMELYQEQLILWEQYQTLFSSIEKFKSYLSSGQVAKQIVN